LVDILVGAYSSVTGAALLTLNIADYGDFPEIPLLTVRGQRPVGKEGPVGR